MLNPQTLQTVTQQLAAFSAQDTFESSIEQIFGSKIDKVKLSILRSQLRRHDFSVIPEIEVLSGGELGTANGGYAASTNKIYLSASFLATASSAAITNVLLEEIGHSIDALINSQDTAGDEGAIFAAFVQGNQLTTAELNILKAEDDRANININGIDISIEKQDYTGDDNNNILSGGAGNDLIQGFGGNDTLSGLGGNDILDGGAGNDSITGGAGNDTIIFDYGQNSDVVTDFVQGQDKIDVSKIGINGWELLKTLITSDAQNNTRITTYREGVQSQLKLQGINSTLLKASDFILDNRPDGERDGTYYADQLFGGLGNDTLNGEQNDDALYGEQGDDILNGDEGNDTLNGGVGNDTLNGGAGNDSITGGAGNDTIIAANSTTAILTIDPKADAAIEANETISLKLAASSDYTIGTATAITGTINNDDILNRPGVELSINDISVVEGKDGNALLTVSLSSASNQIITVNYTTTAINATANGDYTSKTGTLTIPANSLTGTISIPILNDNLNEADESFTVTLSNAVNATINPDASLAEVTITDTFRSAVTRILPTNVENLTLIGTGAINGTGNAGNNTILGNSAANTLNGNGGNDYLSGGVGADTMIGGTGNDTYIVDNVGDSITESTLATDIDTVYATVTHSLVVNVEKLILYGTASIKGTGNSLDNIVIGNSSANTLYGAGGNDTLTGNLGADIFRFNSKIEGTDIITDFTAGDKIALSAVGFGGGLAGTTISASQFAIGSAATTSSQRVIYNSTTGGLFFDADGSGAVAAVQFGTLANKATLGATDFTVV